MGAPTLISYTETVWNTAPVGNLTLVIPAYNTSDVVVAIAGAEGPDTLTVSGGTGLTWNTQKSNTTAGTCGTLLTAAVAASSQTNQTISLATNNNVNHRGFAVWVWRGSQGVGNSSEQHTTTKTVAMTPTAAHCGVTWGTFDFSAGSTPGTNTPTPTNIRQAANDGTHYDFYVADITDQASGGATSYGITGGNGTGPYSIVVLEIKAGASAFIPDDDSSRAIQVTAIEPNVSLWR